VNTKVFPVVLFRALVGATTMLPSPPTGVRVEVGEAVYVGVGAVTFSTGWMLIGAGD
jgi:hypothetical protein